MKKLSYLFIALSIMLSCITSCKKDDATTTTNNSPEVGTWNLQLWDGAPATGKLIFTATTLDFTCSTYNFSEQDTYTKSGNTYTFTKTGGASIVISGGNNWTMDTLTTNVLRMTSKFGLIVRATK